MTTDQYEMKMYDLTDVLKVGIEVYNIENLGGGEFNYSGFEIFTYWESGNFWIIEEIWGVCEPINGKPYNSKTDTELPEIAQYEIEDLMVTEEETESINRHNYWG